MSAFTLDHVRQLADNAFRFRPDKFKSADQQKRCGKALRQLVGKEDKLLEALRAGEQRYKECQAEISFIRELRRSDAALPQWCANLAETLGRIVDSLESLDQVSRHELDSVGRTQGSSFEQIRESLERARAWAEEGAKEVDLNQQETPGPTKPQKTTRGRKPGVGKANVQRVPLEEFAKEIRTFWLHETSFKFSFEAITREDLDPVVREPVSAAARLLYYATRMLDPRVEVGHIEALMRAVNREPDFRTELLDDPIVTALTS
jgi:hypothetical protein